MLALIKRTHNISLGWMTRYLALYKAFLSASTLAGRLTEPSRSIGHSQAGHARVGLALTPHDGNTPPVHRAGEVPTALELP